MKPHMTKPWIIYISLGCLTLFIALAAIGYYCVSSNAEPEKQAEPIAHEAQTDRTYVDLPRMTVSLGNTGATQMQLELALEVSSKDASLLEGYQPQITDRLNVFFSSMPSEKISKPAFQAALRKEILLQINRSTDPVVVSGLLFRKLLVM